MSLFLYKTEFNLTPVLLTWINYDSSMDNSSHAQKVWYEIDYQFLNFNCATVDVMKSHTHSQINICWDSR